MNYSSESLKSGRAERVGLILAAMTVLFALPIPVWADDIEFSEAAIGDEVLAETHGVGQDASLLFADDDPLGDGSTQSVNIGSLNDGNGFGSSNAVAVPGNIKMFLNQ